jgi:hypothetical protein
METITLTHPRKLFDGVYAGDDKLHGSGHTSPVLWVNEPNQGSKKCFDHVNNSPILSSIF